MINLGPFYSFPARFVTCIGIDDNNGRFGISVHLQNESKPLRVTWSSKEARDADFARLRDCIDRELRAEREGLTAINEVRSQFDDLYRYLNRRLNSLDNRQRKIWNKLEAMEDPEKEEEK